MEEHTDSLGCMKPKELKVRLVLTECSISVLEKGIVLKLPEAEKGSGIEL